MMRVTRDRCRVIHTLYFIITGSFEITVDGVLIFSKLKTGNFPDMEAVSVIIAPSSFRQIRATPTSSSFHMIYT